MPQFVTLNDATLHYAYRKRGTAALVLGNSLGTDFRLWSDVIAHLHEDISILRFDKRGHGLSGLGRVDIDLLAKDVIALMDFCKIEKAVYCGVSAGGLIGQVLGLSYASRFHALILSNTGMRLGTTQMWNARIESVRKAGLGAISDDILRRWFSPSFLSEGGPNIAGWRAMLEGTRAEGYIGVSRAIRDFDFRGHASQIELPVAVITGEHDQATPPALGEALAAEIPNAALIRINGIGHLPAIEAPKENAKIIEDHLQRI